MLRHELRHPDPRKLFNGTSRSVLKDQRDAAVYATDRASRDYKEAVRKRIKSVGLGRLERAVGQTSSKLKNQKTGDAYGVVYVRGGDESRAGQALEAYSRGATIRAVRGRWLAFQTNAIPRRAGPKRERMTPFLYQRYGFETKLGALEFRPISATRALLVIKRVTVSAKTGRAKRAGPGKTRTRIYKPEVVAFVLIRVTRRAQRFDKNTMAVVIVQRVPKYAWEYLEQLRIRRSV